MPSNETIIHCPPALRAQWGYGLAQDWRRQYPDVFDADDLRLVKTQSNRHFPEWFAAIHLFHRDGVFSLVEKYGCANHLRKLAVWEALFSTTQRKTLDKICEDKNVQGPDLLAYAPDRSRRFFAEVKGPGDRLSSDQIATHRAIAKYSGIPVEIIHVRLHSSVVS